jgi:hypothetical protein
MNSEHGVRSYVSENQSLLYASLICRWKCKISRPKFRKQEHFRVKVRSRKKPKGFGGYNKLTLLSKIQYSAKIARSHWPDAQRPVEIEAAKGIKGLMTILDRRE